jgi:lipid II:glycine glycyltransferase (peptidoglycan interpeptide bridge formation enzyme)
MTSTKATSNTGTPPKGWDELQSSLSAHFLQSRAWAAFQESQGKKVFYASGASWSWVALYESNRFGSRLYAPYGPTAKSPESLKRAIESLVACAEAEDVDFIRVEPQAPSAKKTLRLLRAKRAHRDIQPKNTLIKDLDRPNEELFAEMMSTNRRLHRRAAETGFTFSKSYDPASAKTFLDFIHQVATRTGIQPHSDQYYTSMVQTLLPLGAAAIFTAMHNGTPVSSSIVFQDAHTRYYAHAASAESTRKLQPSVYLLGYLIFDAKNDGKKYFDYYGVAPPHAPKTHKWAGLSQFKRSFGGREVEYSGTWEIPLKKARYQAYRLINRVQHISTKSRKLARSTVRRITRPKR